PRRVAAFSPAGSALRPSQVESSPQSAFPRWPCLAAPHLRARGPDSSALAPFLEKPGLPVATDGLLPRFASAASALLRDATLRERNPVAASRLRKIVLQPLPVARSAPALLR